MRRRGHLGHRWHPLGSFAVPGSDDTAAAGVPGLRALLTYRDGVARLHDFDGQSLSELTLEEDPAARLGRDPELHVAGDAACLVRDGELAWLLQVDVQHARVLLVLPLWFVETLPDVPPIVASFESLFGGWMKPQGGDRVPLTPGPDATERIPRVGGC